MASGGRQSYPGYGSARATCLPNQLKVFTVSPISPRMAQQSTLQLDVARRASTMAAPFHYRITSWMNKQLGVVE